MKVRIDGLNVSSDGAKLVTMRVVKNPILDGTPAFANVDSNTAVMSFDTAGTTYTGGSIILPLQLGKSDSKEVPVKQFKFDLLPGDMIVISGATISAGTSDIGTSVHWRELF